MIKENGRLHYRDELEIPSGQMVTRRCFYWVPEVGEPVKIVHRVEPHVLDHLPGKIRLYGHWRELQAILQEYGERLVDEVGPQTSLTSEQEESHLRAAQVAENTHRRAWDLIRDYLRAGSPITEADVQEFVLCEFAAQGCETEGGPICAVNAHSADPHHLPGETLIESGDWVLLDLWCRQPGGIYADFTQVAVAGEPSSRQMEIFDIVRRARDAALVRIRNLPVQGWEVDRVAREVIEAAGYGEFFVHRTGHNIDTHLHGAGAQCDDFETHETRELIPGTVSSVEPGIYLPDEFGVRLECNVLIKSSGDIVVTGNPQRDVWHL